jgi:hypothetical protein
VVGNLTKRAIAEFKACNAGKITASLAWIVRESLALAVAVHHPYGQLVAHHYYLARGSFCPGSFHGTDHPSLDFKKGFSPGRAERVVKTKQESRVSNYGFQAD